MQRIFLTGLDIRLSVEPKRVCARRAGQHSPSCPVFPSAHPCAGKWAKGCAHEPCSENFNNNISYILLKISENYSFATSSAIILAKFTASFTYLGPVIVRRELAVDALWSPLSAPASRVAAMFIICSLDTFMLKWCFNVNNFAVQSELRFFLPFLKLAFGLRNDECAVACYLDGLL